MKNCLKIISFVSISFFNVNATNIFCDLRMPIFAAYYYDVDSLYIKANDEIIVLLGNNKVKQLKKPAKNRKLGSLSKYGIGETNHRVILISQNEKDLNDYINKSLVQKIDNNNNGAELGFESKDILAVHVPSKNDFMCIKENFKEKLNILFYTSNSCAYKNEVFEIAKKRYDAIKNHK